ncbi:hypothetical protein QFZ20_005237 [Flavobacterium sp. W4I14]|nr:hypothetical protein [Flavobacterium sp. W4I14]
MHYTNNRMFVINNDLSLHLSNSKFSYIFCIFAAEAGIRACHSEWHILSAS